MTGKTHQVGGEFCVIAGFIFLKDKGYLLQDVHPYLQLLTMYPFAVWGSKASDLDHNYNSIPMKDAISTTVYRLLHLTGGGYSRMKAKLDDPNVSAKDKRNLRKSFRFKFCKLFNARHRSWQTHSDLTLACVVSASVYLLNMPGLDFADKVLLNLMTVGLFMGMASHIVLDALTTEGIPLLLMRLINITLFRKSSFQLPEQLHLVPKSKFFSCESKWEDFIRKLLRVLTYFALIYAVVTVQFPDLPSTLILKLYGLLRQ